MSIARGRAGPFTEGPGQEPAAPILDRPVTSLEAAAVTAFGVVAINVIGIAPVLLGALHDEHRLTTAGMGVAAMAELLTIGVVTGFCGAFLPAWRLRAIATVALIGLAILHFGTASVSGAAIYAVRAAAGVPEGILLWITVGMIARSPTPERRAAIYFTSQVLSQLVLAALLWLWLLPMFGAGAAYRALGLTTLVALPAVMLAPAAYAALPPAPQHVGLPMRGWASLVAAFVFVSGNGAVMIYLQPLAHQSGISAAVVRLALVASLAAQVIGGALATFLAGKIKYITVFVGSVVVYLAAWAVYGVNAPAWLFVAAAIASGMVSLLAAPFLTPMIVEADPTRRAAMQSAAVQLLGAAAGPSFASMLVSDADVRIVLAVAAAALVLGFGMIVALHASALKLSPVRP